ncbi:hypothetical protein [Microbacterium sp.]|uniref:hypothetical protein n=1 Tax=Microbacterium sp. TaxID=51671 RepID=UPI0039E4A182
MAIVLLSLALAGAIAASIWVFLQLQQANTTIHDRESEIEQQQKELDEQRDLIDRKDAFGAAMEGLLAETAAYEGVPLPSLVPWDSYDSFAWQAWSQRWDADGLDETTASVIAARDHLAAQREAAQARVASGATGGVYDRVIDELGYGYVTWQLDDADALCQNDVLACVRGDDPLVVHIDATDDTLPYMTDWIRTGIAYHEFAHVLQYADPVAAEEAAVVFGGDWETMADCFALTYLDGWTLDHRVWVSDYEYWDVNVGYGYACDDSQKQTIRDWRDSLAIHQRRLGPGVDG